MIDPMRTSARLLLIIALSASPSCAQRPAPRVAPPPALAPGANENLHAVLWVQTAVEFKALAMQSYLLAQERLDAALEDSSWTAASEQQGDFSSLPPAVIVDVDETVLDNSAFQARLTRSNEEYDETEWRAWVREVAADPIPGALEFTQYAQRRGVTVFYVTNRNRDIEQPTRENLARFGFPLDPSRDTVLTQEETPEWRSSDKTARRAAVASRFRVLLLVGDDLGDFVPARAPLEDREELFRTHASNWGTRWIVVPNPSYGSWEATLFGFEYDLPREERLRLKADRLRVR
jgi:acid phosphatase